mmetsp:Transcript_19655/g.49079  ORF Transcript_19655/g.49079 Transcript_19655/m.49079 type:complete len:142 (+) Transcript_19655:146-571(+)
MPPDGPRRVTDLNFDVLDSIAEHVDDLCVFRRVCRAFAHAGASLVEAAIRSIAEEGVRRTLLGQYLTRAPLRVDVSIDTLLAVCTSTAQVAQLQTLTLDASGTDHELCDMAQAVRLSGNWRLVAKKMYRFCGTTLAVQIAL